MYPIDNSHSHSHRDVHTAHRDQVLELARSQARNRSLSLVPGLYAKFNASESMRSLIENADEQSFLHFYSNWIIQRHTIRKLYNGRFLLEIFFHDVDDRFPQLAFRHHPGAALFQMNRMAQAVAAVTIGGRQFLEMTDVKLRNVGKQADPVYHRLHRLHSFTTAPTYTPEGESDQEFCGPRESVDCIASLYLTLSAELCREPTGEEVACAIGVSDSLTVPPLPPIASVSILSPSADYEYWEFDVRELPSAADNRSTLTWPLLGVALLLLLTLIGILLIYNAITFSTTIRLLGISFSLSNSRQDTLHPSSTNASSSSSSRGEDFA